MSEVYEPHPAARDRAHISSMEAYRQEYQRSITDPEAFQASIGDLMDVAGGGGDAVDDLTIRVELNQLFFEDNVDLLQSVSFTVIEGRVLLKGSVKNQESRIHAIELAWQASGVREVVNEIQVTDQGGIVNYAQDTWISAQLTTKILFDMDILGVNYNVETINGIIYVAGIAQDEAELDKVIYHARRIENVKKVISHVLMKDDPSPS